ncbi:10603_t:CDS:2, partial [Racocetra fulgida]
ESRQLNEMSTTLNDITNLFDHTDKTTNGLSKRESCPEKGRLENSLDNVAHKENRENSRENRGDPSATNLNGKGSYISSTSNFSEDLIRTKYDNKRTIKPQNDEFGRLNEEIKRSSEKIENQAHSIVLKDCEIKSLQADNKRLTNEVSRIRQDLEKSNANYNKYRELVETKHKTDTETLIFSLQNELKHSQKTNSTMKSQLEDSRALNELLKKNYESLMEENKKLRENFRRAKLERETQLDFVKKLGHEIAMNSGLENDLSKSSLPQVTRNGHSKQISEPIKDSEWTGDSDGDDESPIINNNLDNVFNKNKVVKNGVIIENNTKSSCIDAFNVISTDQAERDDCESRIITDEITTHKQETINGDLNKNKLTKKCSRSIITSSKGRGVKTAKNRSRAESSDNSQVVKKVKSEIDSEKGTQLIKNLSLFNWLNLNLEWFNLSTWNSLIWNLSMTDMIPWNVSRINVEALKIGASALEFSVVLIPQYVHPEKYLPSTPKSTEGNTPLTAISDDEYTTDAPSPTETSHLSAFSDNEQGESSTTRSSRIWTENNIMILLDYVEANYEQWRICKREFCRFIEKANVLKKKFKRYQIEKKLNTLVATYTKIRKGIKVQQRKFPAYARMHEIFGHRPIEEYIILRETSGPKKRFSQNIDSMDDDEQ